MSHTTYTLDHLRVLFFHGKGGSPSGMKPSYLREHFPSTSTKQYNTDNAASYILSAVREIQTFRPHIVVGSSFGSAVSSVLIQHGEWKGPSLLLATALPIALPYSPRFPLENLDGPIHLVHGANDEVIPVHLAKAHYDANTTSPAAHKIAFLELDSNHALYHLCVVDDFKPSLEDLVLRCLDIDKADPADVSAKIAALEAKCDSWYSKGSTGLATLAATGFSLAWQGVAKALTTHSCSLFCDCVPFLNPLKPREEPKQQ